MSKAEHIEMLRRGPRPWNTWRAENPMIVPDLAGISLSIGQRQMGPINGGPINLSRAQLSDATLYFATLTGADMRGADLANADMRGARLEGVDLTGAELNGALLDGADLAGASLKAANLSGASLADVRNLTPEQLAEAEGDLNTVLPYDLERPLIWTVGQGMHRQAQVSVAANPEPALQRRSGRFALQRYMAPKSETAADEDPVAAEPAPHAYEPARHESRGAVHHANGSAHRAPQVEEPAQPETELVEPRCTVPSRFARPASAPSRPEPMERQPVQRYPQSAESNAGESKHITWLVGGPKRVGRRDRDDYPYRRRGNF